MRELVLGCGTRTTKLLTANGSCEYEDPTTLDINAELGPDVVWDLNNTDLPFDDDAFDEIHATDVLEHVGRQGDWKFFFRQFESFWCVLKPGGRLFAICPRPESPWAWGDPGHTRVIGRQCLTFLDRTNYGVPPMTDYRPWYSGDFALEWAQNLNEDQHGFVLQAVKPCR